MTYREIGISIRSAYSQGWPDDASRLAFRTETRKLFRNAGWQVEEMPLDSGHCDTVRNGKDALYLHPTVFSGVMQEDHIPALQRLLDEANTFRTLGTRLYRECFDLTDEEYRQRTGRTDRQCHSGNLQDKTKESLSHGADCRAHRPAVYSSTPDGLGTIRPIHCGRLCWRTDRAAHCRWSADYRADALWTRAADGNRNGAWNGRKRRSNADAFLRGENNDLCNR